MKSRTVQPAYRAPVSKASDNALSPLATQGLFIFILAVAVYIPIMTGDFIWDDDQLLTQNPMMPDPLGLLKLWFAPTTADYFPLTSSTLWIEWRLWGLSGGGYHVTNILLHALDSVLLLSLLTKLRVPAAWLAALLFAVHPVNAESVAWVSERKNTLSMVFYLLTFITYINFEDRNDRRSYWISVAMFFLALTAKTSVVMLPFVLLLLAWYRRGKITRQDVVLSVPFFATSMVLGIVTVYFQYGRAIGDEVIQIGGPFSRLAGAGMAVWFYLGKILWPLSLIEIYPKWNIDPPQAWMFLPGLALAALCYACWRFQDRVGRAPLFALGYFIICLAPVLGFLKMSYMRLTLVADHLQYVPMIGIVALLAAGGAMLYQHSPASLRPALAGGLALIIGSLCWMTWTRAEVHHDEGSLWLDTLRKNPDTWQGNNHYGAWLYGHNQQSAAKPYFEKAVRLKPENPEVHNNLGLAWATQGNLDLAIPEYRRATQIKPDNVPIRTNLANALAAKAHELAEKKETNDAAPLMDEAISQYQKCVERAPADPTLRCTYAYALYQCGRINESIQQFQEALRINPNFAPARQNLQVILQKQQAGGR